MRSITGPGLPYTCTCRRGAGFTLQTSQATFHTAATGLSTRSPWYLPGYLAARHHLVHAKATATCPYLTKLCRHERCPLCNTSSLRLLHHFSHCRITLAGGSHPLNQNTCLLAKACSTLLCWEFPSFEGKAVAGRSRVCMSGTPFDARDAGIHKRANIQSNMAHATHCL